MPKIVILKIYDNVDELEYLKFEGTLRKAVTHSRIFENYCVLLGVEKTNISISSMRINRKKLSSELNILSSRFTHAVVIGDDEIQAKLVKIKNLNSKEESELCIRDY